MVINYRETNFIVMNDTQKLCKENADLAASLRNSLEKEYIVSGDDKIVLPENAEETKVMKIFVSKKRTFEAAMNYAGKKICCLDFANYYHAGGNPWYAGTQEESMCRTSTLYPCLAAKQKEYFEKHSRERAHGKIDFMGGDDIIYVPDVTIFKTDVSVPELMKKEDWVNTDVIVAAAPMLGQEECGAEDFIEAMTHRIKVILDAAEKENVQVLILGAFGCGAFNNPPEIVADIFRELLETGRYHFETVEFPVFCRDYETENYTAFRKVIG